MRPNDGGVNPATVDCVLCHTRLAVDPRNLSYPSVDGHGPHNPVTGAWRANEVAS